MFGLCLLLAGCTRLGFRPPPDAAQAAGSPDVRPRDRGTLDLRLDRTAEAALDLDATAGDRSASEKPSTPDLPTGKDLTKDAAPAKDQAAAKDTTPPKDTAPAKDKPLPKDLEKDKPPPPPDLAKDKPPPPPDLAKDKPLPPPDLAKDKPFATPSEAAGFNPNGSYSIAPTVSYKCAFTIVDFTINLASFVDTGSQLTVTTGPTGPKGGCAALVGDSAFDGSFTATCTFLGSCNEVYTLTGTFSGNSWSGTYSAVFSGSCLNCQNQSWTVSGSRQ